ncbi:response regulator [candidate division CSSED10-310 bacterium]|uniref:histidine kinase n=1 Tax=candidate division CSSED10-310 bacterium TaxID=2855610 RepID=A0ABV6Z192_UNCC1
MNKSASDHPERDILVVDDAPANLYMLSQILTREGYSVRAVTNGTEALSAVLQLQPDLILLDVSMPDISGYQVCKQLKADEATHNIPIIFISALDAKEDKIEAFKVGGVDYITKPFQIEEVLARVETQLNRRDLQKKLEELNSELVKQIGELAHTNAELQARNEELDAFAHTVAHDLKSPLTSLIGYSSFLQKKYTNLAPDKMGKYLREINRSGIKITNIIEELLLLATLRKVESVELEVLNMGKIVAESQERLIELVETAEAKIIVPQEWPPALGRDAWIEEVWVNYMSNAIKYGGQPPHLTLGADIEENAVKFWVRDNGAGLTPEQQARLFTPFERLHQVRAMGHGLGLSIVRRIVEKLGGKVGVSSEIDVGSEFHFTLPQASNQG